MNKLFFLKLIYILLLLIFYIIFLSIYLVKTKKNQYSYFSLFDFKFEDFEKNIITPKMKINAKWEMENNSVYFLNGIIRKIRPKKCLEIGVSAGGSSILILNAIKDIKNSILISLDLNKYYYRNRSLDTGYRVKKYFPELIKNNNWKLFTGALPHIFLDKINMKYDFLYLDTVHSMPGEVLNIIEALPFLEENCTIVLHDIIFHFKAMKNRLKCHPSNIYLFTTLQGFKLYIKENLANMGAIILFPNQKDFYINYFYLLLSPWNYLPDENQIQQLKVFIKKYYKEEIYLYIFNEACILNKIYINENKQNNLSNIINIHKSFYK